MPVAPLLQPVLSRHGFRRNSGCAECFWYAAFDVPAGCVLITLGDERPVSELIIGMGTDDRSELILLIMN